MAEGLGIDVPELLRRYGRATEADDLETVVGRFGTSLDTGLEDVFDGFGRNSDLVKDHESVCDGAEMVTVDSLVFECIDDDEEEVVEWDGSFAPSAVSVMKVKVEELGEASKRGGGVTAAISLQTEALIQLERPSGDIVHKRDDGSLGKGLPCDLTSRARSVRLSVAKVLTYLSAVDKKGAAAAASVCDAESARLIGFGWGMLVSGRVPDKGPVMTHGGFGSGGFGDIFCSIVPSDGTVASIMAEPISGTGGQDCVTNSIGFKFETGTARPDDEQVDGNGIGLDVVHHTAADVDTVSETCPSDDFCDLCGLAQCRCPELFGNDFCGTGSECIDSRASSLSEEAESGEEEGAVNRFEDILGLSEVMWQTLATLTPPRSDVKWCDLNHALSTEHLSELRKLTVELHTGVIPLLHVKLPEHQVNTVAQQANVAVRRTPIVDIADFDELRQSVVLGIDLLATCIEADSVVVRTHLRKLFDNAFQEIEGIKEALWYAHLEPDDVCCACGQGQATVVCYVCCLAKCNKCVVKRFCARYVLASVCKQCEQRSIDIVDFTTKNGNGEIGY